ncbi:MAG: maleylacetoacetate isomerase [Burkholderiaceae bacterium]
MLTLYTYFRSSASFRVRIGLNLKGLERRDEVVWLLSDEQGGEPYRRLNPQKLVPALVADGQVLSQSLAILEYLDETYPDPPLLPATPLERARVRSLSLLVACEIHPLNNLRVLKYLKQTLGQDAQRVDAWYRHWCQEGFEAFERQVTDGQAGRYCHGDAVSLADICLVPQVFNARRFGVDMAVYPATMAIFDRLMLLDAFARAQPSEQPDAARASG